jgi:hypothetical protein
MRESAVPIRTEITVPTKGTPTTIASFSLNPVSEYPFERAYESHRTCRLSEYWYSTEQRVKRGEVGVGVGKANTTAMKSFLGFTVYFCTFVEGYARYAAPLHDMTRSEFSWDEATWSRDYRKDFETFKEALYTAMDLIYPDFDLT